MLRKLIVGNFKAIGTWPIELHLRPLTILVGENGTGKSSMLEGLALLAQSTRLRMKFGLELEGPLLVAHDIAALHHGGRLDLPLVLGVGWQRGDQEFQATWTVRQEEIEGARPGGVPGSKTSNP